MQKQDMRLLWDELMRKMNKTEELVFSALKKAEKPLTLIEIVQKTGENEKKVFKAVRKFFEDGTVDSENRHYKLTNP